MRHDGSAWQVIVAEPCLPWLLQARADRAALIQIGQAITALAQEGPGLSRPLVLTVPESNLPNLRELRPGPRGDSAVRLLVIVDPYRHAIFLVGGDKAANWPGRRKTAIRQAEEAYAGYLRNERMKLSQSPRSSPARSWEDLAGDFGFSGEERRQIRTGADHLIAEVRARRVAEIRKRQNVSQAEVAAVLGVSQAAVSRIEQGQLARSEVETLAAYVQALGGKLKIVADFGDESYVLG
jgi:DNA-binding XRE family transcriptional regulator